MRFLAILFYSVCILLANANIGRSGSPEFARTFNSGSNKNPELSLVGKFQASTIINLLSESDSDICITKTLKTFICTIDDGAVIPDFKATHIEFKPCKKNGKYDLTYLGKDVSGYRIISINQETIATIIKGIDSIIRKKKMLEKDEKIFLKYLSKQPILYTIGSEFKDVYIVQYLYPNALKPNRKYGPLFFFADGVITKIDSEGEVIRAFMLNNRFFVALERSCYAGCGRECLLLFEVTDKKVRKILVDCTFSA